jgi:hypothetical protein
VWIYVIALIAWGVFAWIAWVRPAHAPLTKTNNYALSPDQPEPLSDTEILIRRLDNELEQGETND